MCKMWVLWDKEELLKGIKKKQNINMKIKLMADVRFNFVLMYVHVI